MESSDRARTGRAQTDRIPTTVWIPTIEEMRMRKREFGLSYEEIARRAGLPLGTVQKVLGCFTKNPRHATLAALTKALFPERTSAEKAGTAAPDAAPHTAPDAAPAADRDCGQQEGVSQAGGDASGAGAGSACAAMLRQGQRTGRAYSDLVCEGAPVYGERGKSAGMNQDPLFPEGSTLPGQKRQGEFTIRDRNALPEDHPSELINGVIYAMASPTFRHQTIAGAIYHQLWDFVEAHGGDCMPFIAPTDVRLDRDDYTMVVPDVFVVCHPDEEKMGDERFVNGAPDLVIEVLSPSTRSLDMFVKQEKYRRAGVREYWIVDPQKEKVIVFLFGDEPEINLFGFDSEVPVGIYGNECKVDFRRVTRRLRMAHLL